MPGALKSITTPALEIGYLEAGDEAAPPVVLVHGFPDDAKTWDRVVPILNDAGLRTLCPYVRGYGPTRFLDPATLRSAQYTALAADITAFADALELERFALVGHDWGARASYCVAAMRPRRLNALIVSPAGYGTGRPAQRMSVDQVRAYWYQWFFC
ncbi:MAG: alpha/beta hydrolase, partial [Nitrospinae bacterium]|nr:alpha/beta hydrolase [Nitrospinota bacterium]